MNLQDYIVDVPDWPKEGIVFKDITPLLKNANALTHSTLMMRSLLDTSLGVNYIAGVESRGFIFGAHLAKRMGVGFIPIRKKGKLPPPVISQEYELEYGTNTLEIKPGDALDGKVVLVDDVYATGGTASAARELLFQAGYNLVDEVYLINLSFLNNDNIKSVITY